MDDPTLHKVIVNYSQGNIELHATESEVVYCQWTEKAADEKGISTLLQQAKHELFEYFSGGRYTFSIPLKYAGTPFQKRVWDILLQLPYGTTCSYLDIASRVNNPKAVRAVGSANKRNPLCLFIPCHRVICSSGKVGGYSGGIVQKERLLQLEYNSLRNQ